jgi:phage terminase small subunit|tara:strand:+ start:29 stop:499 length:471 start_codon:yes stop_codon:yes gene_type:complete
MTKSLTDKEKRFAEIAAENYFSADTKSNSQIAVESGYSKESARQRGYENTTYKLKPHVVTYIEELKEDFRIRNQITPDKHMARLQQLGKKAEDKEMLGVALNAEVHRGKMAGYYIDRKLNVNKEVSDMTEEELEQELKNKAEQYGLIDSHNKEGKK